MRATRRRRLFVLILATGCGGGGGGDATPPDAGDDLDATVSTAPTPPAAPAAPALPALAPCPPGWREVAAGGPGGVATCDPWPEGGPLDCDPGEAHFPGEPGCTPVGAACPAGDWPEGLPAARPVRHVRAGAPPGGDGSAAAPYATIAEALAPPLPAGLIVAIAKGDYDEAVVLPGDVALWGACAAATRVASSTATTASGTVHVVGHGAAIVNLRLGGERPGLTVVGAGGVVTLDGVVIDGARGAAVMVGGGGVLQGSTLAVRDTRGLADGRFGRGVEFAGGAQATIERAVFERQREVGLIVFDAATKVTLRDVAIRDTDAEAGDGSGGRGLQVQEGAQVLVERAALERNRELAVVAFDPGTRVTLRDAVIRDTRPQASDDRRGRSIEASLGAEVVVERATLARNHEVAAFAVYAGSSIVLRDVVVRDIWPDAATHMGGRAIQAQAGARATVERALFERTHEVAVIAGHPSTTMTLADVTIRDTQARPVDGGWGRGLQVALGAQVLVERAVFERNRDLAVAVAHTDTILTMRDVVIQDTLPSAVGDVNGRGLQASEGAQVTLERARLARNRDLALLAGHGGTSVTLRDVTIEDTLHRQSDGLFGRGLGAQAGAQVTVERAVIERSRELAVYASQPGTLVTMTDVVVRDTLERTCSRADCPESGGGVGIGAYDEAAVTATRFVVAGHALAGVQLARAGVMDLHGGEIARNPIGANVQTEGFDLTRLTDGVVYRDNGVNLDASMQYVPDPAVPGAP